jgi:hypothetical protein
MMAGMRCSVSVQKSGLDPTGTANNVLGYVVVEWPLPWPAKVEAVEPLAPVLDRAADLGLRVQLAHHIDAHIAPSRVLLVRRQEGAFHSYAMDGWSLPDPGVPLERAERQAQLVQLALDALAGGHEPDADFAPPDVLICTHGKRDVCCGSYGTHLVNDFAAARPQLRVWRTSHLGGHRFAPTALTLPDGNVWAYLDVDVLGAIIDRTLDPAVAAAHYRGCSAARPEAQLAERSALVAEGWPLLDRTRTTGATPIDGQAAHEVWCEVEHADGSRIRYSGRVVVNREIHLPPCGSTDATKPHHDLRIDDLRIDELATAPTA